MKSPLAFTRELFDNHRGTGRTTAMVNALPTDGCIIMVHHMQFVDEIKSLIAEHRPDINISTVKFVSNKTPAWRDQCLGVYKPLYIDHHVLEQQITHQVKVMNQLYGVPHND
jgi:hypothetical protein